MVSFIVHNWYQDHRVAQILSFDWRSCWEGNSFFFPFSFCGGGGWGRFGRIVMMFSHGPSHSGPA